MYVLCMYCVPDKRYRDVEHGGGGCERNVSERKAIWGTIS